MDASHSPEDAPAPGGIALRSFGWGMWGVTAISGWDGVAQAPSFGTHPWVWIVCSPLSVQVRTNPTQAPV